MEALAALPPELVALVIPLLLAYLRVQAAVLVFPVLSERVLSVRVRTAIAMMLAPVALSVSGSTAIRRSNSARVVSWKRKVSRNCG